MTATETVRARHFPGMPPRLPGETSDAYTNRLTGADRAGRIPYDHRRNRQCSIGWHSECSDPAGTSCDCPCHQPGGKDELRAWELEESVVIGYAAASGKLNCAGPVRPGWPDRVMAGLAQEAAEICARRPQLAEWYLAPQDGSDD